MRAVTHNKFQDLDEDTNFDQYSHFKQTKKMLFP